MLAARQQTKEQFRVDVTKFVRQGDNNNPLKFSTTAKDALHNLLVKRQQGYLGAVDAFEDAFEDLRHHQLATLAGVRQAFASMLKHFDPEQLEARFDRHQRGSIVPGRLRYWDLYGEWFRDMVGDVDGSFRTLFGEEFGDAYEEHLRRLKSQARSGDSGRGDPL
jgi:type VI secretion system protein ImpI